MLEEFGVYCVFVLLIGFGVEGVRKILKDGHLAL